MADLNKLNSDLDKARTLNVELLKIKDSLTSDYPDAIRINDKMLETTNKEINRMEREINQFNIPDNRILYEREVARAKAEEEARSKVLGVSAERQKIDRFSRRRGGNGATGGGKRKRTKRRKSKRRKSKKRKGRKSKRRH